MEEGLLILFSEGKGDAGFLLIEDFGEQIFDVVLVESTVRVNVISDVEFVTFGGSDEVKFHKDELQILYFRLKFLLSGLLSH